MKATRTLSAGVPALLLAAAACGDILGFEDSPSPSECIRDADCGAGELCLDYRCAPRNAPAAGGMSGASGAGGAAGDAAGGSDAGGAAGAMGGAAGSMPVIPEGGVCVPGTTEDCFGCDERGHWTSRGDCVAACREDTCFIPPSCDGLVASCGPSQNCCHAISVLGGSFSRGCDQSCRLVCDPPNEYPAQLSPFALDAYEVTVGRFRKFVEAYPNSRPMAGQGKNRHNPDDPGWQEAWAEHLPADADELREELSGAPCGGSRTWTPSVGSNESLPVNCVTWYLAYAFCAWDQGRLPTQAEWNYVAAGGDEQRRYPWSDPPENTVIDGEYAVYQAGGDGAGPRAVGSLALGRGKWRHYDLAGNVAEWVLDSLSNCYETPNECLDCADLSSEYNLKVVRGGSFADTADGLQVNVRSSAGDTDRYAQIGFRCARNL